MKKLLLLSMAVLALAGTSFAAEKIVFIDLERVFNEFYKTSLAKSKMEVQQEDIEAERKIMVDGLTAINNEVDTLRKDARDVTLDDQIRDSKRLQYEEKLLDLHSKKQELEEFTARRQQQLQTQVSRMSQTIMDEIRQQVIDYAKTEGFKAVIDNSTRRAAVGVFIYTHPDSEITEEILTVLNSKRPDTFDILLEGGAEKNGSDAGGAL